MTPRWTTRLGSLPKRWTVLSALYLLLAPCVVPRVDAGYSVVRVLDGFGEPTALVLGTRGEVYGALAVGGAPEGVVFRIEADGTGFKVLHGFTGADNGNDGARPLYLQLTGDSQLVGLTETGGTAGQLDGVVSDIQGCGVIFTLNVEGKGYRILHRFTTRNGLVPRPVPILHRADDGSWLGLVRFESQKPSNRRFAAVFRLSADGSQFAEVHYFDAPEGARRQPLGAVTFAADGTLFGVELVPGRDPVAPWVERATWKSPAGVAENYVGLQLLSDGWAGARLGLLAMPGGVLFGTAQSSGPQSGGHVYRVARDGSDYRVLRQFVPEAGMIKTDPERGIEVMKNGVAGKESWTEGDGAGPSALVESGAERLIGTTANRGRHGGGALFGLNKEGSGFAVLHSFSMTDHQGYEPVLLAPGKGGRLYGLTRLGGVGQQRDNCPVLFRWEP